MPEDAVWPEYLPGPTIRATAPQPGRKPSEIVAAAVARGALTAAGGQRYLEAAADGQDISIVDRLAGEGRPVGSHARPAQPSLDEKTYSALYPDTPPASPGHEPDRLAQLDARRAFLNQASSTLTGQGPGAAPSPPGYGALDGGSGEADHGPVTIEHDHPHAAYDGHAGQHSHVHIHRGDNRHKPDAGHGHGLAAAMADPAGQVAAGIDRMATARGAAKARRPVAEMTEDELLAELGYAPGD